jgi:hypothetical protein
MRRRVIAAALAAPLVMVTGSIGRPAIASPAHHHTVWRSTTIKPGNPKAGEKTVVIARGVARGGRFLSVSAVAFGDGTGFQGGPSCAAPTHKPTLHQDHFTARTSTVYKAPGTYVLKLTVSAPCTPHVRSHHIKVHITVT